ncbi:MAG TPA: hypothetical protein VGX28_02250 [Frankiaceae bacterium]|nr:hypothetical protein [Frankiaceae bacterium]
MTAQRVTVPVPAETGVEDRLAGSLTFRHAAYLAVAAAGVAVMVLGGGSPLRVVTGAVLALVALAGAAIRPYGEPLDRLLPAAVAYLRRRRNERPDKAPAAGEPGTEPESIAEVNEVHVRPVEEAPRAADATTAEDERLRSRVRRRRPWRAVVFGLAAVAVVAVAAARWPAPGPAAPVTRVVVVPVPVQVPAPDPWEEAIDDAVDAWVDDTLGG